VKKQEEKEQKVKKGKKVKSMLGTFEKWTV
jgi:hypothetical protein